LTRGGTIDKIYQLAFTDAIQKGSLESYLNFNKEYPKAEQTKQVSDKAYELVKGENNISGYAWFIDNFSEFDVAKKALKDMHSMAYSLASKENTIDAYNDFIIAYPFAEQVEKAGRKA